MFSHQCKNCLNQETKKQRNFAFVLFQHAESTRYAFDMLQGTKLFGQPIRLQNKETGLGMGSPSFRSPRPPQNIEILDGRSRVWTREGRQRSVTAPVGGVHFGNYHPQQFIPSPRHHFQPPPPFWSGSNYHPPVPFPIFNNTSIKQNEIYGRRIRSSNCNSQNDEEKLRKVKYVDYKDKGDRDEGSTINKKESGNKDEMGNVTEETKNVKESEVEVEKSEIRDKRKSKDDGYQKRGSRSRSRSGCRRYTGRNKRSRSRSYVRSRSSSRSSKKSYRSRRSNSRSYERRRSRSRNYERRRSRSRSKNRDYERRSARKYHREHDGRKRDYYRSRNYRERSGSYERRRP